MIKFEEGLWVKTENAKAALKIADGNCKEVLLALFPQLKEETNAKRSITERVITFEDACREVGIDPELYMSKYEGDSDDIIACMKLRVICWALNEGWKPWFVAGERRWYPVCRLLTKKEQSEKGEQWKITHIGTTTIPYPDGKDGVVEFCKSQRDTNEISDFYESTLYLKSEKLADYCGKQFLRLWADFYFWRG